MASGAMPRRCWLWLWSDLRCWLPYFLVRWRSWVWLFLRVGEVVRVLLRLSHGVVGGRHQVQAQLEAAGVRQTAAAEFAFELGPGDGERIRWYLEDFLEFPADPAPRIALRVEARLAKIGAELFAGVFGSRDAQRLWDRAQERLEQVRVEVETDPVVGVTLPWELMRDPVTDVAVALRARSFVRSHPQPARLLWLPNPRAIAAGSADGGRLRVLLVICRPAGGEDVPFRSVASHLVRRDGEAADRRVGPGRAAAADVCSAGDRCCATPPSGAAVSGGAFRRSRRLPRPIR